MFLSPTCLLFVGFFFFFNDTATTEIYTLSLHDALPICASPKAKRLKIADKICNIRDVAENPPARWSLRSEEHTSELQSQSNLVCRLLLEKKKQINAQLSHVPHTAPRR